jgi:hypothetical protein
MAAMQDPKARDFFFFFLSFRHLSHHAGAQYTRKTATDAMSG